ncbi:Uncharacterised protein [Streptococcus pneumoniae]|nr:Uncharacterised protein [Streptococcus pneumoniae]
MWMEELPNGKFKYFEHLKIPLHRFTISYNTF